MKKTLEDRSLELLERYKKLGLVKGPVVDFLVEHVLLFDFIGILSKFLSEKSYWRESGCITFPKDFDEEEVAEFGPDSILFACEYGAYWEDAGASRQEVCKYLEVAVEFYAEEHPEQEKEVYAYLDKIKEKYQVE